MANPFTTATAPAPASERQISYLRSLVTERAELEGALPLSAAVEDWITSSTKANASRRIDLAKAKLAEARASRPAVAVRDDEDYEGFWTLAGRDERRNGLDHADGATNIYKVQRAVNGSGRLYAKVLDPETGDWIISRGAITEIRRAGKRLTLEAAKDLGHLYGRCIACGRTLTDESSIAAGIGPVCATKF